MHIGIVGCGQLARMLALAGLTMGHSFSFLAGREESNEAVRGLGDCIRHGRDDDPATIYQAMGSPQVITLEKEQVDVVLLHALARFCPVFPDPDSVAICQHRGREKNYLVQRCVPVVPFALVDNPAQLAAAAEKLGYPLILKSCEHGYDGQNQWTIDSVQDMEKFSSGLVRMPAAVLEKRIPFTRELSVVLACGIDGANLHYAVTENTHLHGILLSSVAPAPDLDEEVAAQINAIVTRIQSGWSYVGVLTVECFQMGNRILVNELAPRVHNSGHWTLGGAATSQFENHLRAITGDALGATHALGQVAMVNLLGCAVPESIRHMPNAHVYVYNKAIRPRRKVGHVTLICQDRLSLQEELAKVLQAVYRPPRLESAA